MQIIKKVFVKQVITEKSKASLFEAFKQDKVQLERECEQLLFEQRKLHHKLGTSRQEIKDRFDREIQARKDKIRMIEFKMEQVSILQLGSEIIEKEMDAIVEVTTGSQWSELVGTTSIVVEDDIVIRMDNN